MNRDELAEWAAREGIPVGQRNLTNQGLSEGKLSTDVRRQLANQRNIITSVMKEMPNDRPMNKREEAALKTKAEQNYAKREFARILASKEEVKKDPSRWHELPRVELRDADTSIGPNIIIR